MGQLSTAEVDSKIMLQWVGKRYLLASCFCLFFAIIFFLFPWLSEIQRWAIFASFSCLSPFIAERMRGFRWLGSPAQIFGLTHFVTFPFAGVLVEAHPYLDGYNLLSTLPLALRAQSIAMVVFGLAYFYFLPKYGRSKQDRPIQMPNVNLLKLSFMLFTSFYFIGLSMQITLGIYWHAAVLRHQTNLSYIVYLLTELGLLGTVVAAILQYEMKSKKWYNIRWLLVIVMFLLSALSGKGGTSAFLLILQIYIEFLYRRSFSIKKIFFILLIFLSFVPAVMYYRALDPFRIADQSWLGRTKLFVNYGVGSILKKEKTWEYSPIDLFALRAFEGGTAGRIIAMTPSSIRFAYLDDLEGLLFIWIPRSIFPSKPRLDDGAFISAEYGVGAIGGGTAPPMLIGDLYRRGGYVGILLGMAIMGLIVAKITKFLDWPPKGYVKIMIGGYICIEAIRWYSSTVLGLGPFFLRDLPVVYLLIFTLKKICSARKRA